MSRVIDLTEQEVNWLIRDTNAHLEHSNATQGLCNYKAFMLSTLKAKLINYAEQRGYAIDESIRL